jgi:isopentenyl phosphate kinase
VFHLKDLTIIKLGGSVITKKGIAPPQTNLESLQRIARELKNHTGKLIIVLGGGSYGHQTAHAYGFADISTSPERRLAGVPLIRHNMTLLSLEVEEAVRNEDISAVVMPPFSFVTMKDGQIQKFSTEGIRTAIESGLTVIIHGDVCFDETRGASIISGDTIVVHLAKDLHAKNVFVGTDVDGVMTENPMDSPDAKVISMIDIHNKATVMTNTGPSGSVDVTGGMTRKITDLFELAGHNTKIAIFNLLVPGRLEKLLAGEQVICTTLEI